MREFRDDNGIIIREDDLIAVWLEAMEYWAMHGTAPREAMDRIAAALNSHPHSPKIQLGPSDWNSVIQGLEYAARQTPNDIIRPRLEYLAKKDTKTATKDMLFYLW